VSSFIASEQGSGPPTEDRYRAELSAVLASDLFSRSPKLSRLLTYLCDKHLQGRENEITEYSIAMDVLGRDSKFDPQQDAVVRVDTHHLRKRLKQYYAGAGSDHEFQIVLPNWQYRLQIVVRPEVVPRETVVIDREEIRSQEAAARVTLPPEAPATPFFTPGRTWAGVGIAAILLVLAVALVLAGGRSKATPVQTAASNTPVASGPASEIRIAAGDRKSDFVDSFGRVWQSDRYFSGGTTFHRSSSQIQRARDPELYQSGREGEFVYKIPLAPGIYELHLYFAETGVVSEALRSVGIAINGKPVSNLDIASDAGGINTATIKIFKDISPSDDGFLHLMFQGTGPSFVNALEVIPSTRGKMLPIRLTAMDQPYRDRSGRLWLPDEYSSGGRKSTRTVAINGTVDAALYQTQRYGHFNYLIPVVDGGTYTVIMHFSETWFTPPNSNGGVGSRVFNVYCNGMTLLKSFDILKESGAVGYRSVVRTFHNVPASPQGKIDLSFVPIVNYALVNGIEVIDE
jgi:Malectin domain